MRKQTLAVTGPALGVVTLSILYLRCMRLPSKYLLQEVEYPFNSLFEMQQAKSQLRAGNLEQATFNSLFEMQIRREGVHLRLVVVLHAFNSLFEMPRSLRTFWHASTPTTLSILYLRCRLIVVARP